MDPEQVRQGREEKMNYMVKTHGMFEFGSWHEATSRAGKAPITTKWIDRVKKHNDCREFVRSRLVACDFKQKRGRREQSQDEVKLMFIDVKQAHFNGKYDEQELVELLDEFKKFGKYAKLKRWLHGVRKAASGWEDDNARRLVNDVFQRGRAASMTVYHPDSRACRCAWATTSHSQPRSRS